MGTQLTYRQLYLLWSTEHPIALKMSVVSIFGTSQNNYRRRGQSEGGETQQEHSYTSYTMSHKYQL